MTIWTLHGATTALVATDRSSSAATVIEAISTASMGVPKLQKKNAANEMQNATEALTKAGVVLQSANAINGCVKPCRDQILNRANNTSTPPSPQLQNQRQRPAIRQ